MKAVFICSERMSYLLIISRKIYSIFAQPSHSVVVVRGENFSQIVPLAAALVQHRIAQATPRSGNSYNESSVRQGAGKGEVWVDSVTLDDRLNTIRLRRM